MNEFEMRQKILGEHQTVQFCVCFVSACLLMATIVVSVAVYHVRRVEAENKGPQCPCSKEKQ